MIQPQLQFFLSDSKIHTVSSSSCVLQPPAAHVYEVFRVISGVPLFLEDHLERLQNSMKAGEITTGIENLTKEIYLLLSLNQYEPGNIKIIVWKEGENVHNMVFYDSHLYPTQAMFESGVIIGMFEHERKNPNVKLFDAEMRRQASVKISELGFYEILLIARSQMITECSRSNIFFIRNNHIITPPSDQILEGITRKHIIEIIRQKRFSFSEESVFTHQLGEFDSVFLTGTSRRVLPVKKIEPFLYEYNTKHPLILEIRALFIEKCRKYIETKKSSGKNSEARQVK